MEIYSLQNNIKVFGIQVKTFPTGINQAFDSLLKMLPNGFDRSCYGLSEFDKMATFYITLLHRNL